MTVKIFRTEKLPLGNIEAEDKLSAQKTAKKVVDMRYNGKKKGKIVLVFIRRKFGISSYEAYLEVIV
jgi:hypothetical protein